MSLATAARFLATSPMRTAAIGAGIGAAARGMQAPTDGRTRIQNMMSGAWRGGVAGGAVGLAGRGMLDTRLLHKGPQPLSAVGTVTGTLRRAGQGLSNFGKRQIHGVTGHFDPNEIGMSGVEASRQKARLLELRARDQIAHAPAARHAALREAADKEIGAEMKSGWQSQELMDAGITNLRGIGRGLMTPGRRLATAKAMGKSLVHGPGGPMATMGLPALMSAPSLAKGDESATGGQTVGQKLRGLGMGLATGAAFGGMPVLPGMAAGIGTEAVLSRLRRRPQPVSNYPDAGGVAQ